MMKAMLLELYVRGGSPGQIARLLTRADLPVRSVGVAHVYVEVEAESAEEAIAQIRRLGDWSGDDVQLVSSYLDAPVRLSAPPGREAERM